jgi:ATP-binding cassette subfamily B (MDR/TAP) protein 1
LGIFFAILQGLCLPAMCLILGDLTNSISLDNSNIKRNELINDKFLKMIYLGLTTLVSGFIASMFWNHLSAGQSKTIKLIYFKRLLEQNSAWYDNEKIDQLSLNFINQISNLTTVFSTKMHLIFMNYATTVGGIGFGFIRGWMLTIFLSMLMPFLFLGIYFYFKALQLSERNQQSSYANAGSVSEESFNCIKTIKSLNGEEHEIKRYSEFCENSKLISIKYGYRAGFFWGIFYFCVWFLYAMAFLIGSRLILNNFYNDNTSEFYNAGDVIAIFYSIITRIYSLTNIGPLQKAMESA